jgi:Glycosyl hydrolase family 26
VLQLKPVTRPDRGRADRSSRPKRRRERLSGIARRPAAFVALVLTAALAGAGLTTVGFAGTDGGHSSIGDALGMLPAAAISGLQWAGLEGEATGLPVPDGPAVRAVMPTHAAAKHKTGTSAPGHTIVSNGGTITTGDSKAHCISLNFPGGVLDQSVINAVSSETGVTYNCLGTFANPMPSWDAWESPWMFNDPGDGWDAWLASSSAHQVVMSMDLIPQEVSNVDDPLSWEQACAGGSYNQYATALAQNLVSYGAGRIVIRLGTEANGNWEADYVGTTSEEMSDWAKCFDNEVSAMRAVSGANFLFVWNPNSCTEDTPLADWYPGNAYVDIIGVDAYDTDCQTLQTVGQEGWAEYSTDSAASGSSDPNFPSLANLEAFAKSNGKPLSFPEWGLGAGDDPAYMTGMGTMFRSDDFSFETYFDNDDDGIAQLGSSIPNATAAYAKAFT